ncbi:hypothetical protein [Ruegeria marina]|uniref:Uncharacterized protein n=1 Tax=Ruegeria marina TaxID=639004 RepID=A0A1G6LU10_9RHOB|nr:hypothetical protein [Ruegeria marina]SDC46584.1 hypothetical protein SAMN04488239_102326 [Ruegeria marina]
MPQYYGGFNGDLLRAVFCIENQCVKELYASSQMPLILKEQHSEFDKFILDGTIPDDLIGEWNKYFQSSFVLPSWTINRIELLEVEPGTVLRRMARNFMEYQHQPPSVYSNTDADYVEFIQLIQEIELLIERLDAICRVISPIGRNLKSFGPQISEVHILSCVNIESQMKRILSENGYNKDSYSTSDFVKLLVPMKLANYAVKFQRYHWIDAKKPFEAWDPEAPTKSLPWFDRYNSAKHDKGNVNYQPRLDDVFSSISALLAVTAAQFGATNTARFTSRMRDSVHFEGFPVWEQSQLYIPPDHVGKKDWGYTRFFGGLAEGQA